MNKADMRKGMLLKGKVGAEEKIYELQQKKAKLIDNMLSTDATFINKLSKDDILALFE